MQRAGFSTTAEPRLRLLFCCTGSIEKLKSFEVDFDQACLLEIATTNELLNVGALHQTSVLFMTGTSGHISSVRSLRDNERDYELSICKHSIT